MHPPDSRQPSAQRWVSFDEARMILRMSEGTLRRAIRAGTVQAEQRRRNPDSPTDQRMIYDVLITDPPAPATPPESPSASPVATEPPAAIAGLLELIAADRATIATLYAEQASLRERVGRAEAAIDGADARAEQYALDYAEQFERAVRAEAERERLLAELEHARRPWWRKILGSAP